MAPVAQTGAGNVTTATGGSVQSVTIAKPANITDGDLLVAVVNAANSGGTWTSVPSGWTSIATTSTGRTAGAWYKAVPSAAAETATEYTFGHTGAGNSRMGGLIIRVTGADLTDPIDVTGAYALSLTATSVTTTVPDCLLIGAFWSYITGTTPNDVDPPGGMTEAGTWTVNPSSSTTHLLAQEARATAGATGTRTATATPPGSSALSILVAIAPGAEAHSGTATVTGSLGVAATGTPALTGSGGASGTLAVTGTGTVAISGGSAGVSGLLAVTATGTADTGIGLPPRPRTRWQLIAGPASGGHDLALTAATARRYTAKLTEPSELSFTLDGRHAQAEAVESLTRDVHILWTSDERQTRILDRFRVGALNDTLSAESHTVAVSCLDYRDVLNRRRLYSTDTLTWSSTDQAEIAWGLIGETQGNTGGHLGISKGWTGTAPTGVTRDRTYEAGDSVGERIQELSEVIDGFDWDIVPVSASAMQLQVWHPHRGVDRGVVLIHGGLVESATRAQDPGDYANAIRYTGATGTEEEPGPTAVEAEASDVGTVEQGRWDAVFGDDGLTTQSALDDRAEWQLGQSQVVTPVWTVRLRHGAWRGPDHIWLGDRVRLIVKSGRLDVDQSYRVFEVQIDLDGDGGETVTLTLGGPRPDFRRRAAEIQKRLNELERR